jgi:molybdopterin/thiamine biosynthesis adenylyltransferase
MQANETIKLITGVGNLQKGLMVIWDGESGKTDRFATRKNPTCPVCGTIEDS